MAKYIVKHTTIMHNGKTYAEGSQIELSDNEAARLEDFIEAVPKQTTTSNKSNANTSNKTQTSTKSSTKNKNAVNADENKDDGNSNSEGGNDGNK